MSTFDKLTTIGQKNLTPPKIPYVFGIQQGIESKYQKSSRLSIKTPGTLSNNAAGFGTFGNGGSLFLSTTLTPQTPHGSEMNFAIPYVAIYQGSYPLSGTVDAHFQIYPTIGGSVTPFSYVVQGFFDWHLTDGTISAWGGAIQNNTGSTGTITFITQWRYLSFNSGTVA